MGCRVILMMEEEQPEGLSARKLVVETAKHNVLTAYSADEGIDLLRRFPNVDAALVHSHLLKREPDLLTRIRTIAPQMPIILTSPGGEQTRPEVNYTVDSHQPIQLIQLLANQVHADVSN